MAHFHYMYFASVCHFLVDLHEMEYISFGTPFLACVISLNISFGSIVEEAVHLLHYLFKAFLNNLPIPRHTTSGRIVWTELKIKTSRKLITINLFIV